MEDFSKVYTIEAYVSVVGSWEVIATHERLQDAINDFQKAVVFTDGTQYRLRTPDSDTLLENLEASE